MEPLDPNPILREAQEALKDAPIDPSLLPQTTVHQALVPERYTTAAAPPAPSYNLFDNIPDQLRDDQIDLHAIRRLNLAATVESLERAVRAHEAFPTSDAAIAVASLSEQVAKLTKEIERTQDPKKVYDTIMLEILQPLTEAMVHGLSMEMKWMREKTSTMIQPGQADVFGDILKQAVGRVGPSLKEGLEIAKIRLLKALNIKVKP